MTPAGAGSRPSAAACAAHPNWSGRARRSAPRGVSRDSIGSLCLETERRDLASARPASPSTHPTPRSIPSRPRLPPGSVLLRRVDQHRRPRVLGQLPALAALVAREEDEAALVGALEQHHAHRRLAVRRSRLPARPPRCRATSGAAPAGLVHTRYSSIQRADRLRYLPPMAVTKSIEIRTEIPGPRSREIVERKERVDRGSALARPPDLRRPRAAARRSPTSTATRSSTSPAASAVSTSVTRIRELSRRRRSSSPASRTPTSRSSPTRSTSSSPSG